MTRRTESHDSPHGADDAQPPTDASDANGVHDASHASDGEGTARSSAESSLGVRIPADHVGAFVAQALEDPERTTAWADVVDAMVSPAARDAWDDLGVVERAAEVLSKASEYDRRAIERFEAVPPDADPAAVRDDLEEGLRCRRNADRFRDAVAAAYGEGRLDDDEIVAALETASFDTASIAEREDRLERLDGAFDLEYRPYGGTLMDEDDGPDAAIDHEETW